MFSSRIKLLFVTCLVLFTRQFAAAQSGLVSNLSTIVGDVLTNTTSIVEDPLTKKLCPLSTFELIEYYGYIAEEHYIITEDGYNLTLFRCNSNKTSTKPKRAVIVQHGILASSDDWVIDDPSHGLAYYMADRDYDVWLLNERGNYYSRRHIELDPEEHAFWDFSWYEIGIYDMIKAYEYMMDITGNEQVYVIGHSQGTTGFMAAMAEKPENNKKVVAAALMAPVGFLKNAGPPQQIIAKTSPIQRAFKNTEFLGRGDFSKYSADFCHVTRGAVCTTFINALFGPSKGEVNKTMLPTHLCHVTSGASINQVIHYSDEVEYGYFGRYKTGLKIPRNFPLEQITVPISFHYSPVDTFTNTKDVNRLISQISSIKLVQVIDGPFNHIDFMWGVNAAARVYSKITQFFDSVTIE